MREDLISSLVVCSHVECLPVCLLILRMDTNMR